MLNITVSSHGNILVRFTKEATAGDSDRDAPGTALIYSNNMLVTNYACSNHTCTFQSSNSEIICIILALILFLYIYTGTYNIMHVR